MLTGNSGPQLKHESVRYTSFGGPIVDQFAQCRERFHPSTLVRLLLAALVSCALAPAPANAQEPAPVISTPEKGTWSLAIELPDGGGSSLGLWKMTGERTNFGLQVGFSWTDNEQEADDQSSSTDDNAWSLNLAPTIQRYFRVAENVAPFLIGGIDFGVGQTRRRRQTSEFTFEDLQTNYSLGAKVGIGVDWFPLESISIGAHTGLRLRFVDFRREGTGVEASGHNIRVNTFLSSLLLRIYF